jgi:hypothetical protein
MTPSDEYEPAGAGEQEAEHSADQAQNQAIINEDKPYVVVGEGPDTTSRFDGDTAGSGRPVLKAVAVSAKDEDEAAEKSGVRSFHVYPDDGSDAILHEDTPLKVQRS